MRAAVSIAIFVLGLTAGASALRVVALRAPISVSGPLEHLKVYGQRYDVIVIGSSLVRVNFVPKVFDLTMKDNGFPVHSFSFAMSGLNGSELDYYLERLLRLDLPRLKWILLDVTLSQTPRLKEKNYYKRRVIHWHDFDRFLQVQRALFRIERKPRRLAERWRVHFQHLLLNLGNVGEGQQVLRTSRWLGLQPRPMKEYRFNQRLKDTKKRSLKAAAYRRKSKRSHERARVKLLRDRNSGNNANRYLPLVGRWQRMVSARAYTPFFIIGPSLRNVTFRTDNTSDEPIQVLDLNKPAEYPQLFTVEGRYDPNHMNYEASVSYTESLAKLLAIRVNEGNRR